jgi:hypothetical protein
VNPVSPFDPSSPDDTPGLPPALLAFLDLYGRGEYWESHEVLEGPWRETGSAFYQGLILYASAWVHWQRGNAHGVDAQLRKALERLDGYPDRYLGIDVGAIRAHCTEVRTRVGAGPGWPETIRPLNLAPAAERIRGDEPEGME